MLAICLARTTRLFSRRASVGHGRKQRGRLPHSRFGFFTDELRGARPFVGARPSDPGRSLGAIDRRRRSLRDSPRTSAWAKGETACPAPSSSITERRSCR